MITNRIPLNRNSERVKHDDRADEIRCYSTNNPHYYLSSSGTLESIDLSSRIDTTLSTIGAAKIAKKNIISVGIRKDGNKNKFLGLRPDETQHLGTEQLEFSVIGIELDGSSQPITIDACIGVDDLTIDLGDVMVRSNRQGTRQLIKSYSMQNDFKITFGINLTGLEIQNNLVNYTNEVIRPTYSSLDSVVVSGNFYEPNEQGKFIITTSGTNDIKFVIDKPKLLDSDFNIVSEKTIHTLELTSSGTLEYIKYPDFGCKVDGVLESCSYIDADTYYGSTSDGYIYVSDSSFSTARNASSGSSAYSSNTSAGYAVQAWYDSEESHNYYINRSFFYFDTSAVSGNVTAATLNIYGTTRYYSAGGVVAYEGTQGTTLSVGDFDAFTGSSFDSINSGSWNQSAYNTLTFGSGEYSIINTSGITKICCREKDHDDANSAPSGGYNEGMVYADNTGTSSDPYLSITAMAASVAYNSVPSQRTYFFTI